MFNVSIIFLITGYIAFLFVVKLQKHNHMLFANVLCCFLVAIYLVLNGAFTGATISLIAAMASAIQIFLGSSKILGSLKVRNTVAIAFAAIAVLLLYQKPSDLLPCISFTQNRIIEAQGSVPLIRLGVFFGTILWSIYAFINQLYLMAFVEMSISAYALFYLVKSREGLKLTLVFKNKQEALT
jgi:hypothetical protein